jgi:HEAT repeat protein
MVATFESPEIQHQVMDIITVLSRKDIEPLRELLRHSDAGLGEKLVIVLGGMAGDEPTRLLLDLLGHESERIRCAALRVLCARDRPVLDEIFPLIDDPSEVVSRVALEQLARRRDEYAEDLLVDYLSIKRCHRNDRAHITECYATLGMCGSSRCLPYLRERLMDASYLPDVNRSLHRLGAAVALSILQIPESREILEEASEGRLSSVRLACRQAAEHVAEREARQT